MPCPPPSLNALSPAIPQCPVSLQVTLIALLQDPDTLPGVAAGAALALALPPQSVPNAGFGAPEADWDMWRQRNTLCLLLQEVVRLLHASSARLFNVHCCNLSFELRVTASIVVQECKKGIGTCSGDEGLTANAASPLESVYAYYAFSRHGALQTSSVQRVV